MPRKKTVPAEEPERTPVTENLTDQTLEEDGTPLGIAPAGGPQGLHADPPGDERQVPPADLPREEQQPSEVPPADPLLKEAPPETWMEDGDRPEVDGGMPIAPEEAGAEPPLQVMSVDLSAPVESPAAGQTPVPGDAGEGTVPGGDVEAAVPGGAGPLQADQEDGDAPAPPPKNDRQQFYGLDFHELDRDLTTEERQEWNSIYASYRGRSALTGTIIGVDPHSINVWNRETETMERQTMYCAIVVPYRVRVVIPASEMWEQGRERPDFVLQNMVGGVIDFIIIKVDRESGFAIGSRRLALRSRRYYFSRRPALQSTGARLKCRVMSVGPRRCLVECYGHDLNLTQRELRYTAIPDLRDVYHPGQELDCLVKSYDPEKGALEISVKETESNPFDGAEFRHPVGSRRQGVIAGKYGGGVFCNLPDGAVCMCNYSYQHEDSAFMVGDTVILLIQRYDVDKKQMYGKILTKW